MDHQDLRTLKLFEAIESGQSVSQRDIARQLDISLGLVNSFIKRLVRKGYFKITHIPRNRVAYMLTPKGAAEKTRLTYAYIQYSFRFYRSTRQKMRNLFAMFKNQGISRVALYGVSDIAEIAYLSLQENQMDLTAIADDELFGQTFLGLPILSLQQLKTGSFDRIICTALDAGDGPKKLRDHGFPLEKIVTLE